MSHFASISRRDLIVAAAGAAAGVTACGGGGGGGDEGGNQQPSPLLPALSISVPRLRGAHVFANTEWASRSATSAQWNNISVVRDSRMNVARLFLQPYRLDNGQVRLPGQSLAANIDQSLSEWSGLIDWLLENNIYVMLSLVLQITYPATKNWPDDGRSFWSTPSVQDELVALWASLGTRFVGRKGLLFNVLSEPHGVSQAEIQNNHALPKQVWNSLYPRIVEAVRAVDADRSMVIEPIWGDSSNFVDLAYVDYSRLIYSFHEYRPHYFTHQGVPGWPPSGSVTYPGVVQDNEFEPPMMWDRAAIADRMQAAVGFSTAHGARMMTGEFGVVRAAPDSARLAWINDVISLSEAYGFDGVFFQYEGWSPPSTFREGWSFENTSIQSAVLSYFARN